jgi:leucyl aminopeptidase
VPVSADNIRGKPVRVPHLRLQLVSLDVLQTLSVSSEHPSPPDAPVSGLSPAPADVARPDVVVTSGTPFGEGEVLAADLGVRITADLGIDLARRLRRADATGESGEVVTIDLEDDTTETLLVLGLGDRSPDACRKAGATLASHIERASVVLCDVTAAMSHAEFSAFCEGLLLASYRFSRKSVASRQREITVQLAVAGKVSSRKILDRVVTTAKAVTLARDFGNRPSNEKNPQWIAERAVEIGKSSGLRVRVFDEVALAKGRFGGLLAVGGGSASPPRLVVLEYRGEQTAPKVVLVGKGITFDSGGLSLKPADGMPLMKTDMSGAGTVLATMSALRDLGVTANVTAVLACAENMPSGSAYRPGDVVRHFGGRTSEVFNTDAEGRMVLADALAYANARLRPDVIVDIATLTGAATLGLSRQYGALFADGDGLAERLLAAGQETNDKLWRLPLVPEYRSALDSDVADISHVSRENIGAGAITAALFLQEFVGDRRWAHLDIAGPARAEKTAGDKTRGATGFGVRLLLRWLQSSPDLW